MFKKIIEKTKEFFTKNKKDTFVVILFIVLLLLGTNLFAGITLGLYLEYKFKLLEKIKI